MMPRAAYQVVADSMPILCVDLFLQDGRGRHLEVHRNNAPLKGRWWVPGGRVFRGETLEQAAVRKAFEELGLAASSLRLIGYHEYHLTDNPFGTSSGFHAVSFVFTGIVDATNLRLDDQSSDWGWFSDLPAGFDIQPFNAVPVSMEQP